MKKYILVAAILLISISSYTASAQSSPSAVAANTSKAALTEGQKIEQLINTLRAMEGTSFIRNGSEHSAQEAADHLESKWKKHSDKIKTAEDFIEHLATKSSMTGEQYMIKFSDGRQVPTADLLYKKLEQLNKPLQK